MLRQSSPDQSSDEQSSAEQSALGQAAHLVRRTSVGVHSDRIAEMAELSWDDAISRVLSDANQQLGALKSPPKTDDLDEIILWWINQMISPTNGLLDRMSWFWHGVLTTSLKAQTELIGPQIHLLRSKALGNYRDLLQAFVIDGALLQFLDGTGSQAHNPNENLGRELMELFSIGRGNFTQDDVQIAARALAGWQVDEGKVSYHQEDAFHGPALFRGEQKDWDTKTLVNSLCDDPLTAIHISTKLWDHLVGTGRSQDDADGLGQWWHEQGLDILPLVERILRSDEFADAKFSRAKSGFEWWASMMTATNREPENPWVLNQLGQMPYQPPNVGGWQQGDSWLAPGSILTRTSSVRSLTELDQIGPGPWPTSAVLEQCGLHDVSPATKAVLDGVGRHQDLQPEARRLLRWRVALCSPEFNHL